MFHLIHLGCLSRQGWSEAGSLNKGHLGYLTRTRSLWGIGGFNPPMGETRTWGAIVSLVPNASSFVTCDVKESTIGLGCIWAGQDILWTTYFAPMRSDPKVTRIPRERLHPQCCTPTLANVDYPPMSLQFLTIASAKCKTGGYRAVGSSREAPKTYSLRCWSPPYALSN